MFPAAVPSLNLGSILDHLQIDLFRGSDTPRLDAQVLLSNLTGKPRSWILAHPEASIDADQQKKLTENIHQLEAGIPLPYVIGHWEFFNLDFTINRSVLIPRPETEFLVEKSLEWLKSHPEDRRVLEIGTGSGCIAVSLAAHLPDLQITATDISKPALQVAQYNAARHNLGDKITFCHADLLPPPGLNFNLICANLPYIPAETLRGLEVYGREPTLALDGGPDGLSLISRVVRHAGGILAPGGILLLEIEASQGKTAIELAEEHFPESQIGLYPDYSGHDRLLLVQT
jgi:release factor glutamine methyltransferase